MELEITDDGNQQVEGEGPLKRRGRSAARAPESARSRWVRRLGALAIAPVFLLGVEIVLRVSGFGAPAGFFVRSEVGGRAVWVDNADVARRFFPPGLARVPQPAVLTAQKPAGACRIFVMGGSAAMGDPEPAYGMARMVQVLLEARYPHREFEVVNAALTAVNSHVVREVARDCAARRGDIWVVYMGNNEVVGPYGAGTIFGGQVPPMGYIRASLAVRATRLGQAIEWAARRVAGAGRRGDWGGMEMFLDHQVPAGDPRLERMYGHFRGNLEAILREGTGAGASVIVAGVMVNLLDCPPFASRHGEGLTRQQRDAYGEHLRAGDAAAEAGDWAAARTAYEEAVAVDDQYAEGWYRLGRTHAAAGAVDPARQCLERARDLDTLRFRIDATLRELTRETADAFDDGDVRYVEMDPGADPPGFNWLYEHVHLNPDGNYLAARAVAEAAAACLPDPEAPASPDWLTAPEVFAALALTDWDRRRVNQELLSRLARPPFTNQSNHPAQMARLRALQQDLEATLAQGGTGQADRLYRDALARRPHDWVLHEAYGRFLAAHGRAAEAEPHWRQVTEQVPHYPDGYFGRANALDALGRSQEAAACYREVLALRPDSVEALNGLGLALEADGQWEEARTALTRATELNPGFAGARINLGQVLARMNRPEEAMAQYRAAIQADTNSAAAYVNLGGLLEQLGRQDQAVDQYRRALRADPHHAVAHFNLGVALLPHNEPAALGHFAQAAQAQPDFTAARFQLGMCLARSGRSQEALHEFQAVVALDPDSVEARLRMGSLLASSGRLDEAIAQFEQCLRIDPQHQAAAEFLHQARNDPRRQSPPSP